MSDNNMNADSWITEVELEEAAQTSSTTESKTPNNEESKTPSLESKTPDPESKTPDPETKTQNPEELGACALPTRYTVTVEADKVRVTNNGEATLNPGNEVAEVTAVDQLATALNKVRKGKITRMYGLLTNKF